MAAHLDRRYLQTGSFVRTCRPETGRLRRPYYALSVESHDAEAVFAGAFRIPVSYLACRFFRHVGLVDSVRVTRSDT